METTGTFFSAIHPLLVLSGFGVIILFAAVAAIVVVVFAIYKSNIKEYGNSVYALEQQVADMQQHLEYASREETKARADAKRSAHARDKLLSSLNHEIRTPMNGILGMTLLLEETNLAPEQRDYVDTIISTGKTLLLKVDEVMANDELEQSKIDRTIYAAQQKAIFVRTCVEDVIENFAVRAAEKQTELLYCIDENVPAQVLTDIKRLQQVLINLVDFVMENQKQPQVIIGVHTIKYDRTDVPPSLGFTVGTAASMSAVNAADILHNGISIIGNDEKEQDDKIRGLSISKKLVEEMGGQVRAGNKTEVFVFCIPLSAVVAQKHNEAYSYKDFEGKKVLVVNGNNTAANIFIKQLQQWKMQPVIANNSNEALQIAAQQQFSIIITEMNLPGTNGMEFAAAIKKANIKTPVLLLNSVNDNAYQQYKDVIGSVTVLKKPLKQNVLSDVLLSSLRQSKITGQAQSLSVKTLSHQFSKQYPLRILVAEDNEVNQKWALKILAKMGYEADIAENGHIALDMVGKAAYDVILMDVQMPEMDGIEATKMIRVCLNRQPVIIAMTANVMVGDRMACMQAGMDDYISKPVQLNELVNTLEKWAIVIAEKRLVEAESKN